MLWLPQLLRTRDELRDWRRIWRDKPGLLPAKKVCCCEDEPCFANVGCCSGVDVSCRLNATIELTATGLDVGSCSLSVEMDLCYAGFATHWYGVKTVSGYTWYVDLECVTGGNSADDFRANILVEGTNCVGSAVIASYTAFGQFLEADCVDAWENWPGSTSANGGSFGSDPPTSYQCDPFSMVFQKTVAGVGSPGQTTTLACACGETNLSGSESYDLTLTVVEP